MSLTSIFLLWSFFCAFGAGQEPVVSMSTLPKPLEAAEPGAPVQVEFRDLKIRHQPIAPPYPALARIAMIQGTVVLKLTIDSTGKPEKVEPLEGPPQLYATATKYAVEWLFDPVVIDGKPAKVQCTFNMPFKLQDIPPSKRESTIKQIVLKIEQSSSAFSVPLDAKGIEQEVRAWLAQRGVAVVDRENADPGTTHHLRVDILAVRTRDDIYLYNLMGRCSLLADENISRNDPGKPQRIGFGSQTAGQKGESGFQASLLDALRQTIGQLINVPSSRGELERAFQPAVSSKSAVDGQPRKIVDFNFNQIKVKNQPSPPAYPKEALARGVEGTVVVDVFVDPKGSPSRVIALSGPSELLITAIRFALKWEFEPAKLNGIPQTARFKLTLPFRIRENPLPRFPDPRR